MIVPKHLVVLDIPMDVKKGRLGIIGTIIYYVRLHVNMIGYLLGYVNL